MDKHATSQIRSRNILMLEKVIRTNITNLVKSFRQNFYWHLVSTDVSYF